ncbi:hypothetical protein, partial [Rhizobium sp. CG5]|uniref:hypothetical protein n=1 Tax=Rhizobium sp. CG5 TaxID=2726076 RepID=UPI002033EC28
DVMRCCAAEMAPHRNPPLPHKMQQPKTAGANSKLDKTWGQGQALFSTSERRFIMSSVIGGVPQVGHKQPDPTGNHRWL